MIKIENQKIKKSKLIEELIGYSSFTTGAILLFPAMVIISIGVILLSTPINLIGIFMIAGIITPIISLMIHGYRSTSAFIEGQKTFPRSKLENMLHDLNEEANHAKKQLKIINKSIELVNLNLQ